MNVKTILLVAAAVCCILSGRGAEAGISVQISNPEWVIADQASTGERWMSPSFRVIVSNTSDKPQRIPGAGCSFGYDNLSFELTDEAGEIWQVAKRTIGAWKSNGFDVCILQPRESYVIDVDLRSRLPSGNSEWCGLPPDLGVASKPKKFTVQAAYENKYAEPVPSYWGEPMKHPLWAGRVTSKPEAFLFKSIDWAQGEIREAPSLRLPVTLSFGATAAGNGIALWLQNHSTNSLPVQVTFTNTTRREGKLFTNVILGPLARKEVGSRKDFWAIGIGDQITIENTKFTPVTHTVNGLDVMP